MVRADWQLAVAETMDLFQGQDYAYGSADCVQFVNTFFKKMTGRDGLKEIHYTSESEGEKIIKEQGNLMEAFKKVLGPPKPKPEPGDIVMVGHYFPAIFNGHYCIGILPGRGLSRFSLNNCLGAWSCHK